LIEYHTHGIMDTATKASNRNIADRDRDWEIVCPRIDLKTCLKCAD